LGFHLPTIVRRERLDEVQVAALARQIYREISRRGGEGEPGASANQLGRDPLVHSAERRLMKRGEPRAAVRAPGVDQRWRVVEDGEHGRKVIALRGVT